MQMTIQTAYVQSTFFSIILRGYITFKGYVCVGVSRVRDMVLLNVNKIMCMIDDMSSLKTL